MSFVKANKPHAVLLPFPTQGHINSFMQLAKLLHHKGFHITYVNTEFNHDRLIQSNGPEAVKGLPDFIFTTIPDGLPYSDRDGSQDVVALCDSTQKNCLVPFSELLGGLMTSASSGEIPPVSCVISDGLMSFAIEAAEMFSVPEFQYWTASASGLLGYLHYSELEKRGIVPFQDDNYITDGTLDTPIDWIEGMRNIRLKDIPSFIRTTNPNDIMFRFMGSEAEKCLKSSAIIFNTFEELDREVLDAIKAKCLNIYTIGPLALLSKKLPEGLIKSIRPGLWKEDTKCLEWLDKRNPNSVVYVNYGSLTKMSEKNFNEFAWGLANSKHPFLWVVRVDCVMGDSTPLSEEFYEEIKDRGFIANWCPQDVVLAHPSVGVFLTHCGWNSTMDTICGGVPLICWPYFAEQQTNRRFACTTWDIGIELNHDVKRDEVVDVVRIMMDEDDGNKKRRKALDWKMKAKIATDIGGSSYNSFEKLIQQFFD